jgi:FkbH-like protein
VKNKYHHLLRANNDLGSKMALNYRVAVLANTTINSCKEVIEYALRVEGVGASVEIAEYDNIVQDSERLAGYDCVIVFWDIANIIEDFPYRLHEFNRKLQDELLSHVKSQIKLCFDRLSNSRLVLFNKFSSAPFTFNSRKKNELDLICEELNNYLSQCAPKGVCLIDIERIYLSIGVEKSIHMRFFISSKALYSIDFHSAYAEYVTPFILSSTGKSKKVLIFDCDNTLWKGVLGEDGLGGVRVYKEIQNMAVESAKKGVIIGLCSKNNPEDVDEMLSASADQVLRDDHIVIKAVNWEDKASNLKRIAHDLNLGLDSIVFVDDSAFEINLIKEKLPEITVIHVPEDYVSYVSQLRFVIDKYFYKAVETTEDYSKIKQYKTEISRVEEKGKYLNIEDYLKSLNLYLNIYINPFNLVERLSQLTQKTNQFNLTTRRYTPNEIKMFINDPLYLVVGLGVTDKFGDYGVTGLAICYVKDNVAKVDSFILSCRILGRNIEFKFMSELLRLLQDQSVKMIHAEFLKTAKNLQVSEFYEKAGFIKVAEKSECKLYEFTMETLRLDSFDYIGVSNECKVS